MPTRKRRAARGVRSPDKRQTPTFVTPMAALLVDVLPEGSEWSYELKLDGSPDVRIVTARKSTLTERGFRPSADFRIPSTSTNTIPIQLRGFGASSVAWLLGPEDFAIRDPTRRDRLSIDELRPKARSTNCIENHLRVLIARVVIYDARVLD